MPKRRVIDTISVYDCPDIQDFYMLNDLILDKRKRDALAFIQDRKLTNQDYIRVCLNCDYELPSGDFLARLPSPVAAAAMSNETDMLNELVSLGFDPNAPCVGDWRVQRRPITFACNDECFEVMKVLVRKHKVDVDIAGDVLLNPLKIAVLRNRLDIVKFLLKNGADVNAMDSSFIDKTTAFHIALETRGKNIKLCEYLISKGADVNKQNDQGDTPLHSLCYAFYDVSDPTNGAEFKTHMAKSILAKGVNVNTENNVKQTPFNCAIRAHGLDLLKVLYAHGADPKAGKCTALHQAIMYGTYKIIHYLVVDLNVSLDKRDPSFTYVPCCADYGCSPLLMAVYHNHPKVARLIVQAGYDLQQENWIRSGEDPFSESNYVYTFEGREKLVQEMHELSGKFRSLQELCCFKVRHLLGRKIHEALDSLYLPKPVKDLIKLTHLE